ncbi:hypothetical protein B0H14DRAFT_3425509 [Mycena olivaceomarginata]|nr:hypothetical protein B0H14DRAFT_3425509 [Mycena olivaceomarginata]
MSPHKSPNPFPQVKNSRPPPPDYSSCQPIEPTLLAGLSAGQSWGFLINNSRAGERHDVRLRTMTPVDESRRVDDSATRADESTTPTHAHTSSTTRAQANDMMFACT